MTPEAYRRALPRLYGALLARHGGPNEVQLAAAEPILAGRDVLICAPTASGKTEAYLAPLAERHVPKGADGPRLLLVSPTRVLVNDLARRVGERLARAGIDVGRWTGDHHDGGRLQPVTVVTPEALDSRLSRAPDQVAGVTALVLDELHVLDGTARGDQLRILVERLRTERGANAPPLQVVAASATVPDIDAMARRYLRDPERVAVGDRRRVKARIVRGRSPAVVARVLGELVRQGFRKVLIFCNSREEVEVLARGLRGRPPFGSAVLAHHGSLARTVRLSAERSFLVAPAAACVCTSTMELGVDIGDIDLVALVGAPPNVSSLLQRVGRGGRRGSVNHAVAFASGPFEESVLRTLLRAQRDGEWFAGPSVFRPGVLVQQAMSVLYARRSRTVDAGAMHRRLPPDLAQDWPPSRLDSVLAAAAERGWLARAGTGPAGPVYRLGARGEREWAGGRLHGNLADPPDAERTVVDALTGDVVGSIAESGGPGLGGRGRRTVHVDGDRLVTISDGSADLPSFRRTGGFICPSALATALLRGAGIPVPCRAEVAAGTAIFHGLGTAGGLLLARMLKDAKFAVRRAGRLATLIEGSPDFSEWPSPARLEAVFARHSASIARKLSMGRFHDALPADERLAALEALCELDRVRAVLGRAPPPEVEVSEAELWEEAAFA